MNRSLLTSLSLTLALGVGLSLAGAGAANPDRRQDQRQDPRQQEADKKPRRLESITWNSVDHKLSWVITSGEKPQGGDYKPVAAQTYVIEMDDALMLFDGEKRRFSRDEANSVRMLMDLIARYAVESTLWWDAGKGEKVDPNNPGLHGDRVVKVDPPEGKREKPEAAQPKPSPGTAKIALNQ